jgi:putative peptide zinc metalloprotease protein
MRNRRLTAFFTTLLLALIGAFGASPALAADPTEHGGKPGDNLALAINEKDGATVVDVAFSIRRVMSDVVDNQNVALAYSSCTSCTTVAIAFQILIVIGEPDTFSPVNMAVAVNAGCNLCNTLASAYQFAFGADAGFRFTKRGLREILEIKRQVKRLAKSGKPITEIQAGIDALADRLKGILERELETYRKRRARGEDQHGNQDEQTGDDSEALAPDESGATGPTGTETTPSDTTTTPSDTGTETTPSDTTTTPSDTGTETTPTDTGTSTTPSG